MIVQSPIHLVFGKQVTKNTFLSGPQLYNLQIFATCSRLSIVDIVVLQRLIRDLRVLRKGVPIIRCSYPRIYQTISAIRIQFLDASIAFNLGQWYYHIQTELGFSGYQRNCSKEGNQYGSNWTLEEILPVWAGSPLFSDHSLRSWKLSWIVLKVSDGRVTFKDFK